MPIWIELDDGTAAGMMSINLDNASNLDLKETIMGRSLTPPPDGGPEFGIYYSGDGILPPAPLTGTIANYVHNKFQSNALQNIVTPKIAPLTATSNSQQDIIDEIIGAEINLLLTINTQEIKEKIKEAVKRYKDPLEKEQTLTLNLLESLKDISSNFAPLIPNTYHNKYFQITYTHPEHPDPNLKNVVLRFGIIAQSCDTSINTANISIEYALYNLAKDYLTMSNNHVVLLDIFAREDGAITEALAEDNTRLGFPETHTIVLWKQSNSAIFVLDPNQKIYSDFIVRTLKALGEDKINNEPPQPPLLGTTFYKNNYLLTNNNKPKVGRGAGYMRDCIDIAIKAGFELNRLIANAPKPITTAIENNMLQSLYQKFSNPEQRNEYTNALKSMRDVHGTNIDKSLAATTILEEAKQFLTEAKLTIRK